MCKCDSCKLSRKIKRLWLAEKLSNEAMNIINDLRLRLSEAETDVAYENSIVDGNWPQADEVLRFRGLKRISPRGLNTANRVKYRIKEFLARHGTSKPAPLLAALKADKLPEIESRVGLLQLANEGVVRILPNRNVELVRLRKRRKKRGGLAGGVEGYAPK